ncbi:peptidylprolyl isomerase [Paenibacillus sp. GCM10028914]|uniref:peptidylprolyl isomerase n=1 Tax=Paenibacillus sp. GCM10028914 TaxID=3273416 RepID=UPI00361A8025
MKQRNKLMIVLFSVMTLLVILSGCGVDEERENNNSSNASGSTTESTNESSDESKSEPSTEPTTEEPTTPSNLVVPDPEASHPVVTIEMDSGKIIKLELYPEVAPNTVNNFISLVKKGFYDGVVFHRVIPGFMIQGGDPDGTGGGGPDYSIAGEFTSNGVQNDLEHTRGVLSMARTNDPNSAGSQFFIMHADAPHLDTQYAAFGKVTEGMEVVDEIAALPTDGSDRPDPLPTMKKVTVDTLGKEYPEPEKQ